MVFSVYLPARKPDQIGAGCGEPQHGTALVKMPPARPRLKRGKLSGGFPGREGNPKIEQYFGHKRPFFVCKENILN